MNNRKTQDLDQTIKDTFDASVLLLLLVGATMLGDGGRK